MRGSRLWTTGNTRSGPATAIRPGHSAAAAGSASTAAPPLCSPTTRRLPRCPGRQEQPALRRLACHRRGLYRLPVWAVLWCTSRCRRDYLRCHGDEAGRRESAGVHRAGPGPGGVHTIDSRWKPEHSSPYALVGKDLVVVGKRQRPFLDTLSVDRLPCLCYSMLALLLPLLHEKREHQPMAIVATAL